MTRARIPLWTVIRGQLRDTRDTRRALRRDLASYTSPSHLNDLYATLDRYSDQETAEIRRILAVRQLP